MATEIQQTVAQSQTVTGIIPIIGIIIISVTTVRFHYTCQQGRTLQRSTLKSNARIQITQASLCYAK